MRRLVFVGKKKTEVTQSAANCTVKRTEFVPSFSAFLWFQSEDFI